MEYKVVYGSGGSHEVAISNLEMNVKWEMNSGWIPQGGVSIAMSEASFTSTFVASQALVREK